VLSAALAAAGFASPAAKLRERQATLASRQTAAAVELFALQATLARADARLAALRRRTDAVEAQLARLRIQLDVARRTRARAQALLGARIRQLYEHGQIDPVAILLGSESLNEAVDGLEGLRSLAAGDRDLLQQVTQARDQLRRAKTQVNRRAAALRAAEGAAAATSARLRSAAAERRSYIRRLRSERGYTARQIQQLEAVAVAAQEKSTAVTVTPVAAQVTSEFLIAPPDAAGHPLGVGAQLTVVATGYAIRGRTATGLAASWGVVAVDPSVIPLGTRMTIPGYGEGVAADTGGAVQGDTIDLWFPTRAQALAWGRRTVTITLHG
jgi:3D (Asp-Asp-Asp) domain-containing protein/peptidoglycan hydrolase CwlO-like protein